MAARETRMAALSPSVIYLDRSRADLKLDLLYPPDIRFKARSAIELQCSYILFIVSLVPIGISRNRTMSIKCGPRASIYILERWRQ